MSNKEMRRAADRMVRWIERIVEEQFGEGVRESTVNGADAAKARYILEKDREFRQVEFKKKRQSLKSGDSEEEEDP